MQCGVQVLAVLCDVAHQEQVHARVDLTTQGFGRVDIVVNNAGILQVGPCPRQVWRSA
jgi:NAD(P)-dependent dehydrogenase (short-subunit alcohol dehydrogenase family)